jgi:hypothetical protein
MQVQDKGVEAQEFNIRVFLFNQVKCWKLGLEAAQQIMLVATMVEEMVTTVLLCKCLLKVAVARLIFVLLPMPWEIALLLQVEVVAERVVLNNKVTKLLEEMGVALTALPALDLLSQVLEVVAEAK